MRASRLIFLMTFAVGLSQSAAAQTVPELYDLGVQARLAGRNEAAIEYLDRALALDPRNADALVQLGFARLGAGDLAAAQASFGAALDLAPGYADATYGLALVAYREGEARQALDLVTPLVGQYPDREDFVALADGASAALQPVAVADPTDDTARLMRRARDLRLTGDPAAAEAVYRTVLARDAGNIDALVGAGLASGARGDLDGSSAYLDAALASDPRNLDARLARARLAVWQEDLVEARRRVDAIRSDEPANGEALLLDARLSLLEGRLRRSAALFEVAAEQDTDSAEAVLGLGDVRRLQGREPDARAAYARALALDPGSAAIAARLAAPRPTRWRIDAAVERSTLTGGLADWHDTALAVSYRPRPDTTVTALLRSAQRFGFSDEQAGLRVDRRFADVSVSGLFAAAPDAEVLAEFSLGAGVTWTAPASFFVTIDALWQQYDDSRILILRPAVGFQPLGDRLRLVAGLTHAADFEGASATGITLRGEAQVTDRLALLAGASDAPEVTEGVVIDSRSAFAGISFDLTESVSFTGSFARVEQEAYDRDTVALALTARF